MLSPLYKLGGIMKLLCLFTTFLSFSVFASPIFLEHVKSSAPTKHILELAPNYVVIETSDACNIGTGETVKLYQYGSRRGIIRSKTISGMPIECGVLRASTMTKINTTIYPHPDGGMYLIAKDKYYKISSLAGCEDLLNDNQSELWFDYRPNGYSTIIVSDSTNCLRPSLRKIQPITE